MKLFENNSIDTILEVCVANAEWFFADAEEIGSSDVSACVRACVGDLGLTIDELTDTEIKMLRNGVNNAINGLETGYVW